MDFLPLLLAIPVVWVSVYMRIVGRRRVRQALSASFSALTFNTPGGPVAGDVVRVVKIYKQGMQAAYDDVFSMSDGGVSDSFWYCVGPDASYFLAIPLVEVGYGRAHVTWVVRSLTAERLRLALQDDAAALQSAFEPDANRCAGGP